MFKYSVALLLSLFLIACASKDTTVISPSKKAFEEEDSYILYALYAKESKDFKSAALLFDTLYKKSKKTEYFYQSLESSLLAKEYDNIIQKIDSLKGALDEEEKLLRFKIVALYELDRLDEAQKLAMSLADKTQSVDDYILVGDVLVKSKQHDLALHYLQSAYAKEYDEKILDKISIILYVNLNRQSDAIKKLETHSRMHGISKRIASRLLAFYSDQNNLEGVLLTYKRLYSLDKDKKIAKKIVQIYTYERNYSHLLVFLEESKSDDALLLQLYASAKNYKKAYPLADALYEKTGDVAFLGQSAIYEYESADNKNDKKLLARVARKLQTTVADERSPIYLNYLGYLLIDHKIDVKKGMLYIEEVLKSEPESAYYLDSLAWGYYQLGECKKAQAIMKRVQKLPGGDHEEVQGHVKKIQECLHKNKKEKK